MRIFIAAASLALAVSGCASLQSRFNERVKPGQAMDDTIAAMGKYPDRWAVNKNEQTVGVWNVGGYTYCGVVFDDDQKVLDKRCETNLEERARDQEQQRQAAMMYMQMQAQQPAQPAYRMPTYQAPRSTQSNCQSRISGGTIYSDCSSRPTGVDTSIYQNVGN